MLTEDDSGRTLAVGRDAQIVLRLHPNAGAWDEPQVAGDAVVLAERNFLVDPGYREWEVRVTKVGRATITTGWDPCPGAEPPCGAPGRWFELWIQVS